MLCGVEVSGVCLCACVRVCVSMCVCECVCVCMWGGWGGAGGRVSGWVGGAGKDRNRRRSKSNFLNGTDKTIASGCK